MVILELDMPKTIKVAISLPTEVFEEAEKLSKEIKRSRSAFYADAIKHYMRRAEILKAEHADAEHYKKHGEPFDDGKVWEELYADVLRARRPDNIRKR